MDTVNIHRNAIYAIHQIFLQPHKIFHHPSLSCTYYTEEIRDFQTVQYHQTWVQIHLILIIQSPPHSPHVPHALPPPFASFTSWLPSPLLSHSHCLYVRSLHFTEPLSTLRRRRRASQASSKSELLSDTAAQSKAQVQWLNHPITLSRCFLFMLHCILLVNSLHGAYSNSDY